MTEMIGPEAESQLTWPGIIAALEAGHLLPRAEVADLLLYRGADTLLDRAAWITGLGSLVKVGTIHPGNGALGLPSVNGIVTLYNDKTGVLDAVLDFHMITKWKTAGDSLLAASKLARADAKVFLLIGAGAVSRSMVQAYSALWPEARFLIWNRGAEGALRFAAMDARITVASDLQAAVRQADVICTATMAEEPLIKGEWLQPGQHLDLIGAYTPSMREVDDLAMQRAAVFVDARATTVHHIGELMAPIASGAIKESDIRGDFYDIAAGVFTRESDAQITIAKNGGGAHLDLMTAHYVLARWRGR